MLKKRSSRIIAFVTVVIFITLWSLLMYYLGPEDLILKIGVRNGYILAFFMAVFGGISALSSSSFYLVEISLVMGGLNPFLVGLLGGIGLSIGDSLFFLLGDRGRETITNYKNRWIGKFSTWLKKRPSWLVPVISFVYSGMTPLPNDILMVAGGLSGIKYKRMIYAVVLGNIFLTTLIAYLTFIGWKIV